MVDRIAIHIGTLVSVDVGQKEVSEANVAGVRDITITLQLHPLPNVRNGVENFIKVSLRQLGLGGISINQRTDRTAELHPQGHILIHDPRDQLSSSPSIYIQGRNQSKIWGESNGPMKSAGCFEALVKRAGSRARDENEYDRRTNSKFFSLESSIEY